MKAERQWRMRFGSEAAGARASHPKLARAVHNPSIAIRFHRYCAYRVKLFDWEK
jgi:hypothetical protein